MELLDSANPQFNFFRDYIITESESNPIYASQFTSYYEEYFHRKLDRKLEYLVVHEGKAVLLFLLHDYAELNTQDRFFSYFGLPGIIALNPKVESQIRNLALKRVVRHLGEIGVIKDLKVNSFRIDYPNPIWSSITPLEEFISLSTMAHVYFERVIDLSLDTDELNRGLSKSVKSAIKHLDPTRTSFKLVDYRSPDVTRKNAIDGLKDLHFSAAGRKTRTDKSWEIQESLLENGSIVIGLGYLQEKLVHGAMFMLANASAYYAVSANSKELFGTSVAHPFIYQSILGLKVLGVKKIFMGRQFEELTREITEKERNIAKFKSFFGGNLMLGLGFSNAK